MIKKNLKLWSAVGVLSFFTMGVNASLAQEVDIENWPSKPIRINIHGGPGTLDTMTRQFAKQLKEELGVNVIAENRPGGGQSISQTATQSRPADGYTIQTMTGSTSFGMAQGIIPYSYDDWTMLASVQQEPASFAVLADSPIKSIDDFVEIMKEDPKSLIVGGYSSAGFMTYVYYQLQQIAGFEGTWIPIDTTDQVTANLLGGHIDVAVMSPSSALSSIENGDIRLLAISSGERSKIYPDTPTLKEEGYEVVDTIWRGFSLKKGTPKEIVDKLFAATQNIVASEEWQDFQALRKQDDDPVTPEEMDERLKAEVEGRTGFLKHLGLIK